MTLVFGIFDLTIPDGFTVKLCSETERCMLLIRGVYDQLSLFPEMVFVLFVPHIVVMGWIENYKATSQDEI